MARYTTTIKDILQTYAGDEEQWVPGDLYLIAKDTLFSPEVLGVIKEEYRQHFVTSFAYHYFLDQIGLETFGLWKFRLAGRIYENAEYINQIYETINKEIFSEYRVIKRDGNIKDTGSLDREHRGQNVREIDNAGDSKANSKIDRNGEQITENNLENKTIYNSEQKNEGTTKQERRGNDKDILSGSDWTREHGQEKNIHGGYDKEIQRGERILSREGEQISEQQGSYADSVNEVNLHSDTPMGSLENMRTPNEDAAGKGVSYATGSNKQYNYLSDAQEHDYTSERTYKDHKNITKFNGYKEKEGFQNYEREEQYNSNNTLDFVNRGTEQEYGRVDTQEYHSDNTQIDDTTSKRRGDDTEKSTGNQKVTSEQHEVGESKEEHADFTTDKMTYGDNLKDIRDLEKIVDEDVVDYKLSYEMLLRTEPLMQKIWKLFDTLFLIIF